MHIAQVNQYVLTVESGFETSRLHSLSLSNFFKLLYKEIVFEHVGYLTIRENYVHFHFLKYE
jgi:hypothetical protein